MEQQGSLHAKGSRPGLVLNFLFANPDSRPVSTCEAQRSSRGGESAGRVLLGGYGWN